MNVTLTDITVRDLVKGYVDDNENGVRGYDGRLDIRPPYQREFVYKDVQRNAVIVTVMRNFPLNVMYWSVRGDGNFEIIDGQQRTVSICQYVRGDFSLDGRYFHNLATDEQERILSYVLTVYLCSGTDSEKLEWFRTVNIAGEELMEQEIRNAVYAGPWVTDAKRHFSKTGCPAYQVGKDYLQGTPIRQDYLETAIKWSSDDDIESYMAFRQHERSANGLWLDFQRIIAWVKATFPQYRREMKGIPWGPLCAEFSNVTMDPTAVETEVAKLMADEDVTNKRGIYAYVLTRKEKYLNIRAFTNRQKREAYERQVGVCPRCSKRFEIDDMEGDHIIPWRDGGMTTSVNCQMLCREDNRKKSSH